MVIQDFIRESNRIENIYRAPTHAEIDEAERFLALEVVTVADLERFVSIYQPGARLRDKAGLDVVIAKAGKVIYRPPVGRPQLRQDLENLLRDIQRPIGGRAPLSPFAGHRAYEALHPFTDGNGRSGRMLWLWQMKGDAPLGFLHTFYYQTLGEHR